MSATAMSAGVSAALPDGAALRAAGRSSAERVGGRPSAPAGEECSAFNRDASAAALTRREREIVAAVSRGLSNKQIAREQWVSLGTVKFHLSNVYAKLGVTNRVQLVRWNLEQA